MQLHYLLICPFVNTESTCLINNWWLQWLWSWARWKGTIACGFIRNFQCIYRLTQTTHCTDRLSSLSSASWNVVLVVYAETKVSNCCNLLCGPWYWRFRHICLWWCQMWHFPPAGTKQTCIFPFKLTVHVKIVFLILMLQVLFGSNVTIAVQDPSYPVRELLNWL